MENIGSVNHADVSNVDTDQYTILVTHILIPSLIFKHWKAVKLTVAETRFSKFSFVLGCSNVIINDKYCQLFSLK